MDKFPALQIKKVSKSFGSKSALKDVDLEVSHQEIHILLGLSGSGKSTLIRLILGLLEPDQGQISLRGKLRHEMSSESWAQEMGYVPQEGGLFPHLDAAANVTLMAQLAGWSSERRQKRLEELCPLLSFPVSLLRRFPRELSGGQKQRVALLRAAFMDPPLLIMDEPLGALDPLIRVDVQNELKTIFQRLGKSVLMVTHDLSEARFFGDRLSLLHEGQIVQSGTFTQMRDQPSSDFVRRFFQAQRTWDESP